MNTYIVLLRGINVGGHKKIPMATLRELLSKSGFNNVKTYIQSGNIVLQSPKTNAFVEDRVRDAIRSHFGFEVPVIARTRPHLLNNFQDCPFSDDKKENSYFVLLNDVPSKDLVEEVRASISYENEEYHIVKDCLYFFTSMGYGKSKFNMNAFERKLQVKATTRNYKTMVKLLSMSSEDQ